MASSLVCSTNHFRRFSAGGDHAMQEVSTNTQADGTRLFAGQAWFDLSEAGIRDRVGGFTRALLEQELTAALGEAAGIRRAVFIASPFYARNAGIRCQVPVGQDSLALRLWQTLPQPCFRQRIENTRDNVTFEHSHE